jgi:ribosomal protein L37AE/L43A
MASEAEKAKEMKRDAVLGRINLALLHYAGYAEDEIAALGDLSELPESKMQELVEKKVGKVTHCPECRSSNLLEDYDRGEIICQNCGLVFKRSVIEDLEKSGIKAPLSKQGKSQ